MATTVVEEWSAFRKYNEGNQALFAGTTYTSLLDDNMNHPPAEEASEAWWQRMPTYVQIVAAGDGVSITGTDEYPIINVTSTGGVQSIVAGAGISVGGDPANPTVTNAGVRTLTVSGALESNGDVHDPSIEFVTPTLGQSVLFSPVGTEVVATLDSGYRLPYASRYGINLRLKFTGPIRCNPIDFVRIQLYTLDEGSNVVILWETRVFGLPETLSSADPLVLSTGGFFTSPTFPTTQLLLGVDWRNNSGTLTYSSVEILPSIVSFCGYPVAI